MVADGLLDRQDLQAIDLAHEAPFRLGVVQAHPATRQLSDGRRGETLEPRVMQVLVALARAGGAVVSRNDLTASCWDGRIVGDNAINRVISRLRAVGAAYGAAFEIETITKVGYRLSVGPPASAIPQLARPTRALPRRALVGVGLAAVGGPGGYAWLAGRRHRPPAAAVSLYNKGLEAQQQALPEQTAQAVSYLREAVRIDPDYADAWGALALSYRHQLEGDGAVNPETVARWITAAADRALQLDPGNADADVAKLLIRPNYRNWAAAEADYRAALVRHPDHWLLRGTFGRLMYEVGRWNEGLPQFRANVTREPFLTLSRYFLAYGLWSTGRWPEAEAVIEAAFARWPTHPTIWFQRFDFLVHTGRPEAAAAFAADIPGRPLGVPDRAFQARLNLAEALGGGGTAAIERSAREAIELGRRGPGVVPWACETLASLNRLDPVFDLLDAYFRTHGAADPSGATIGPLARRGSAFLFSAPTVRLRADPRFAELTRTIGLQAYWRAAGVAIDSLAASAARS